MSTVQSFSTWHHHVLCVNLIRHECIMSILYHHSVINDKCEESGGICSCIVKRKSAVCRVNVWRIIVVEKRWLCQNSTESKQHLKTPAQIHIFNVNCQAVMSCQFQKLVIIGYNLSALRVQLWAGRVWPSNVYALICCNKLPIYPTS